MLVSDQNVELGESVIDEVSGEQVLTGTHEMYHVLVICCVMRVSVSCAHAGF